MAASSSIYCRCDDYCRCDVDRKVQNVTYCTDVEGHWHYFCSFVELSDALRFAESGCYREAKTAPRLILKDDWHFVFGGDTCDKGPGSLRFLQAMVDVKKAYPDRVHMLMGNREVNKMRYTSELDQEFIDSLTPDTPPGHWVKGALKKKPWDYIAEYAAAKEGVPREDVTDAMVRKYNTKMVRFLYHFKHDMGSDGEFEFRRQEMAVMSGRQVDSVTDDEVVASFIESIQEGGVMREYIKLAQLACILGETLFTHGQIIGNTFIHSPGERWVVTSVPDDSKGDGYAWRTVEGLEDWVRALNEWAKAQTDDWQARPKWDSRKVYPTEHKLEDWRGRGGADFIIYGTPDSPSPTIVYCRWLEDDSMPKKYPPELVEYLRKHNVSRVVVGHTPHGNCPTVIPHEGGVVYIMADTSFSNFRSNKFYAGDNRGDAVCEVALQEGRCTIKGRTGMATQPDGYQLATFSEVIDYRAPPGDCDQHVGAIQPLVAKGSDEKRFFVKAKIRGFGVASRPKYLLCHVKHFQVEYQEVEEEWVTKHFGNSTMPRGTRSVSLTSFGEDFGQGSGGFDSEVAKRIFQSLDRDGDGCVTVSELLSACTDSYVRHALAWSFPGLSLEQAFAGLDADKDGTVSLAEFRSAVCFGSRPADGVAAAQGEAVAKLPSAPLGPPATKKDCGADGGYPSAAGAAAAPRGQAVDSARGDNSEVGGRLQISQCRINADADTSALSTFTDRADSFRRKTKIICTMGPACIAPEILERLIEGGMNIARLNLAAGTHEMHTETVGKVRAATAKHPGKNVAILMDIKGQEIRTGFFREDVGKHHDKTVWLLQGQDLKVVTDYNFKGDDKCIAISYKALPTSVKPGNTISVSDGALSLKVKECGDAWIMTEVMNSFQLGERKVCSLPGIQVHLPVLQEKDVDDLVKFAIPQGVDFIAVPFVQSAGDVEFVRKTLGLPGRSIKIVSKIENLEGLKNIDAIVEASDAVMFARGEQLEIPTEKVFLAQKMVIARCNLAGKPVITASQMLASMVTLPRPTRAEASDVANAVLDGTDCVMLSEETARGQFPVGSASIMRRICEEAEAAIEYESLYLDIRARTLQRFQTMSAIESVCSSAVEASIDSNCPLIIVLTETGYAARAVAKYRPKASILAVSASESTVRQLGCTRGVRPMFTASFAGTDAVIAKALEWAKRDGMVKVGDSAVAVHGQREELPGHSNLLKIVIVP